VTLARDLAGDGPPLLLLHAGIADARMWAPLSERLAPRFRTIAPDLPSFGRTPPAAEPFAPVRDLVGLLDELDVEHAAVVGASFGGRVAMDLATQVPDRVTALVLLASNAPGHEPSPARTAYGDAEEAAMAAGDVDAVAALAVSTWVRDPEIAPLVADMARVIAANDLAAGTEEEDEEPPFAPERIRVRTLLVDGGLDLPDFAAIADRLAETIPDARRATVPDAGHLIALERPDAVAELVTAFLA
jgi:3-oxoadipate enol-lactonase